MGLSSGRPKPGGFSHHVLRRGGARIMPSPLAVLNPTAAYSEIVRRQSSVREVQVKPLKSFEEDSSNVPTPTVPPRTPDSKVIVVQPIDSLVTSTPAPRKPTRSEATLRKSREFRSTSLEEQLPKKTSQPSESSDGVPSPVRPFINGV